MSVAPEQAGGTETTAIRVHYWASARAAAGVAGDELRVDGPITLEEVVRRALELHPGTRLPDVLKVCSTLVGDRPVSSEDPGAVLVAPGSSVEFLPPFAGG
jgi:molybdopterin converting factor small subunit